MKKSFVKKITSLFIILLLMSLSLILFADVNSELLDATYEGNHTKIIELLVKKNANVNTRGFGNMTPLLLAAMKGNLNLVNYFMSMDGDINATDINGDTPLMLASINRHPIIVKALLESRAKINEKNKKGFTIIG